MGYCSSTNTLTSHNTRSYLPHERIAQSFRLLLSNFQSLRLRTISNKLHEPS